MATAVIKPVGHRNLMKPERNPEFDKTVIITKRAKKNFNDDYVMLSSIGTPGAFGKAYRIRRKSDKKLMAVKEISKAKIYSLNPRGKPRQRLIGAMKAEIDIMRTLEHKYIVQMYETHETKHTLSIVMEECKGGELFERIKAKRRYKENDAKPIIKMILEAIFYMHDKHRICHLDLKPDNILFVDDSDDSDIKIIDFGMSQILPRLKSLRHLCGTPYYTAPEIIRGEFAHSADLWSVGVIAYVMIYGFPPFYVDPNKYESIQETKEIYRLILKGFDPRIKKGYGAHFPRTLANKLGEEGRDFLSGLMETSVAKRMTAKEALSHPWLKSAKATNNQINKPQIISEHKEPEMDLTALQCAGWATSNKFKYAISGLFQEQFTRMRPKHFEQLKRIFSKLDQDNNGIISFQEFEEGMTACHDLKFDKQKIGKMFSELAIDNAQGIHFGNLLNAAVHDYLVESDVRLYEAFAELDATDCGNIKTADLKNKIREMQMYDEEQIEFVFDIIDNVDLDNDGTIDYEEFLRALHPDFNETPNWMCEEDNSFSLECENSKSNSNEEIGIELKTKLSVNPNAILMQGYMKKEGKFVRSWKKRWFTLTVGGKMSYFANEKDTQPIATFSCREGKLKHKSWKNKEFGIKLYTAHRNWKLLLANEEERGKWYSAMKDVSRLKSGQQYN